MFVYKFMSLKNALVVDDEEDICLLVSLALKNQGVKSTTANSITHGIKLINEIEGKLEFAFLDLNLPDGVGFELIPHLRNNHPDCIISIISAYDGVQERRNIEQLNIDHFIKKPFSKNQIIDIITTYDTENSSN